jgi:undecaprenyl-diphosphatase
LSRSQYLLALVIVATIPGGVVGLLVEKPLDTWLENDPRVPLLLAATLPLMGLLLYIVDRRRSERKSLDQVSWWDTLLIGVAQAFALVPGVSRSGATITMSRFLTFDRSAAARFSFLLSAPITAAAVLFKIKDILPHLRDEAAVFAVGVLVSGAVGALAIGFLINYIRRAGFGVFAVYRFLLAAAILLVYFLR